MTRPCFRQPRANTILEVLPVLLTLKKTNLRFVSFNFCVAKNKLPFIADVCNSADITFLQETCFIPSELNVLNSVSPDFYSCSIYSIDPTYQLIGRPCGGVSILWKKKSDSGSGFLVIKVYLLS